MRVLVATASRHGSTRNIGSWIATALTSCAGNAQNIAEVDLRDVEDVDSIAEYDAVVLGSAVYMGRWLASARSLVAREQAELDAVPVWLFSSGPIGGTPPSTRRSSWDEVPWAVEHRTFGGKLDRSTLSRFERLVVRLIRAEDGDDRSRADIESWARSIGDSLETPTSDRSR
ncbi:flavodoxin domain-containing protein [Rhodococcus sp. MEB041]|uniref:flavodoxin domain-containing protein n=1 Tax=Rhodococcus sp. MEB041 TaxID=3040323 RepID=UPI00254CDB91|nr:flavodoxin domain-containing protein [Rhodococcus sp. MEB041]